MDISNSPELFDSHCHLHYDFSPKTVGQLISEAQAEGVNGFVTIGTDPASFVPIQKLAEEFSCVWFTAGVHPHDAKEVGSDFIQLIRPFLKHSKCVAVGEIGLDTHYNHSPLAIQLQTLEAQLELAAETSKPVVVHSREAEAELLNALQKYAKKSPLKRPGVIHCFTGTEEFAKKCVDLGFFISFSGILTFKNSQSLRDCAQSFSLNDLLVETDSPYLAPIPFRGKKCEPSMVKQTALVLAQVQKCPFEEVAVKTTQNTKTLFGIR